MSKRMDAAAAAGRRALAGAATNTSLFVFAAFLFGGVTGAR